jgi:hypothetical protein
VRDDTDPEDLAFYLQALEGLHTPAAAAEPAIRLARSLRRLMGGALGSDASACTLDEISVAVDKLADKLKRFPRDNCGQWGTDIAGASGRYLCHPLTGPANPIAPPIEVSIRDGEIFGEVKYGALYEGRFGAVHPSFVAAAVVTMVSLVTVTNGRRGTLKSLTVRFTGAAPLDTAIEYRALIEIADDERTTVSVKARTSDEHVVSATAEISL